jgi:hypothetical protein
MHAGTALVTYCHRPRGSYAERKPSGARCRLQPTATTTKPTLAARTPTASNL